MHETSCRDHEISVLLFMFPPSSYGLVIFFLPFTLILHLALPHPEISKHRLARSALDFKVTEGYTLSSKSCI